MTPEACLLRGGPGDRTDVCPIHETREEARTASTNHLARTTFASLAAIEETRPR